MMKRVMRHDGAIDNETIELQGTDAFEKVEDRSKVSGALRSLDRMASQARPKGFIAFIIAETGMGKTSMVELFAEEWAERGYKTRKANLANKSSASATNALVRLARSETAKSRSHAAPSILIIDNMPPTEECDLGRQSSSLSKMVGIGTIVLVCMLPEAVQLAEEMSDAPRVRTSELMIAQDALDGLVGSQELTRRIPALYKAMLDDRFSKKAYLDLGSNFLKTLSGVMLRHLRASLPREELEFRLAMMLLGSGTIDEVEGAVRRVDPEIIDCHQSDAPFFGVDRATRSFMCAGLCDERAFNLVADALRSSCSDNVEVAQNVADALARRGEFWRCARVAALCPDEVRHTIAATWGVELVCCGEVGIVRDAIAVCDNGNSALSDLLVAPRRALALIELPSSDLWGNMAPESRFGSLKGGGIDERRRARHLELLQACRDLDRGMPPGRVTVRDEADDRLALAFVEHLEVRSLLLEGSLTRAYSRLVNSPFRMSCDTLAAAFLCDDYEIAAILLGEDPDEREVAGFDRARQFLANTGISRLSTYRLVLDQWVVALAGRNEGIEGVEAAIACAEHMGDTAVRACLLVGAAICDLRRGYHSRAHVRALQASELSMWLSDYVGQLALCIDGLAHLCLGNSYPLKELSARSGETPVAELSASLADVISFNEGGDQARMPTVAAPDRDVVWMLNLLCNDLGEVSVTYRSYVPETWSWISRRAVRKADALSRTIGRATKQPRALPPSPTTAEVTQKKGADVSIHMLGDFEVRVRGVAISPVLLERRRAGALLACLAAHDLHKMRRVDIVESIWPEYDYFKGLQKLYESTSRVRSVLRTAGVEGDPFAVQRGEGTLALNSALVTVDVDEFVRKSRIALATSEDERVIELASEALEVYSGDLYVTAYDAQGVQSERRDQLRELFVDLSVVCARAALRDGRTSLAVRVSHRAHDVHGLREDVVLVLVESLKVAGRFQVARDVYREFAQRLLETTGMPPSTSLRRAVESLFPPTRPARSQVLAKDDAVLVSR